MSLLKPFAFIDPGPLVEGDLVLALERCDPARSRHRRVPVYHFGMFDRDSGVRMGDIELRIGDSERIRLYAGHIGYGVERPYRGRRLAARSCRLILPLAWSHGIDPVWITCNPDNLASRRTCELAGAVYVQTVDLPPDCDMYQAGERRKCRYRIDRPADFHSPY